MPQWLWVSQYQINESGTCTAYPTKGTIHLFTSTPVIKTHSLPYWTWKTRSEDFPYNCPSTVCAEKTETQQRKHLWRKRKKICSCIFFITRKGSWNVQICQRQLATLLDVLKITSMLQKIVCCQLLILIASQESLNHKCSIKPHALKLFKTPHFL